MIKSLVLKKNFKINSSRDVYRYYSSIQSFCVFIKNILKKKNTLTFKNKSLIVNFTSDKVLSLTTLVNYIHKIKKFENCKIFYKHQKLRKEKKIDFDTWNRLSEIPHKSPEKFNEDVYP